MNSVEDMSGNVMNGGKRNTRKNRKTNTRKNRKDRKANTRKANTRKNNMRKTTQMGGALKATGTKAEVWHGTAKHTSGGLKKSDLMKTKRGRIVSKRKHAAGQKAIAKLRKMGYVAKKGTFKLFRKH
jgi:hypothetical protein